MKKGIAALTLPGFMICFHSLQIKTRWSFFAVYITHLYFLHVSFIKKVKYQWNCFFNFLNLHISQQILFSLQVDKNSKYVSERNITTITHK